MTFSASRSAAVAKSPAVFSNRLSSVPYIPRTTAAPACAALTANSASAPALMIIRAG